MWLNYFKNKKTMSLYTGFVWLFVFCFVLFEARKLGSRTYMERKLLISKLLHSDDLLHLNPVYHLTSNVIHRTQYNKIHTHGVI